MIDSPFSLKDKIILITGASSGIGRAVAQACAQAGATCVITARNEQRLTETLCSLEGNGHRMLFANLSDPDEVESLASDLPQIDGAVLCAGIVETLVFKFSEDNDMTNVFNSNTFSTIRLLRTLVQRKLLKKSASVAIISSISGVKCGYLGGTLYGASKGALEGFVKAFALEMAPQRIRVNTICPGMVETNLLADSDIDSEQIELDKQRYPLKRYGRPDEIGLAAVYLMSDATKWMTGTSLLIDGGYTIN